MKNTKQNLNQLLKSIGVAALLLLLEEQQVPRIDAVETLVGSAHSTRRDVPQMSAYSVELGTYDGLLSQQVAS